MNLAHMPQHRSRGDVEGIISHDAPEASALNSSA